MKQSSPYSKFVEDFAVRQLVYGMAGTRDRNEGGVPSGDPLFDPGFFGGRRGSRGLDIDKANFEMWKRKMIEEGKVDNFFGPGAAPRSIAIQDVLNNMESTSVSPYFGVPNRRKK